MLLDCIITSTVQQCFLNISTNFLNCKPFQAAINAINRKINKYKVLLQLYIPGTKFLSPTIETLSGTHPKVSLQSDAYLLRTMPRRSLS
jgi:hypothetical protein